MPDSRARRLISLRADDVVAVSVASVAWPSLRRKAARPEPRSSVRQIDLLVFCVMYHSDHRRRNESLDEETIELTNIDGEPLTSDSALGVDVVAAVIRVSDLDQSVNFFCEVFSSRVVVRHSDMALLLTPTGFEIYLHQKDELHSRPHRQALGVQYLMWAADSPDDLERIAGRLRARDNTVYTYVEGGMTIV
jgi:hypothetical protein